MSKETYELYILHFPNGKRYAGITSVTAEIRFYYHCAYARQKARKGVKLLPVHKAINKYGAENIRVEVVLRGTKNKIIKAEIKIIAELKLCDRRYGYNSALGGNTAPSKLPEAAAKISVAVKKAWEDAEYRVAQAESKRLADKRPEVIERRSKARKLVWENSVYRARYVASAIRHQAKPGVREAHSKFMKDLHAQPEFKAKLKESLNQPEVIERKRASAKAAAAKPEVKARISAAAKLGWIKRKARGL